MMNAMNVRSVRKHKGDTSSDGDMTELDIDSNIHDQLPHVETVKSTSLTGSTRFWRRVMIVGVILLVVLAAILIPLGIKASDSSDGGGQPSGQNLEEIETFLMDYIDQEALADKSSPQYKAAKWMSEDELQIQPQTDEERFLQRYSLAVLYFATQGEDWTRQLNFLTKRTECNWHQKLNRTENGEEVDMGVYCDEDRNVVTIRLQSHGLSGTLPAEIKYFPKLETLALDGNQLVGSLPRLNGLDKLTSLTVTHNDINGPLPNWISTLTGLRVIGFSDNGFRGTIPELWSSLGRLTVLGLDGNELDGNLKTIEGLTSLEKLYLESNAFTGDVGGGAFMTGMRNLKVLDISNNQLHGEVQPELLRLADLEILDLSRNNLDNIANNIARGTSLRFLSLHSNEIVGAIPSNIHKLVNLQHLDLSSNDLRGDIPTELGNLQNLTYLFLGNNERLNEGPLPDFIRGLTNLEELSLKLTQRTGAIPVWLSELDKLILLDLDYNSFNGQVPTELGTLQSLRFLLLSRNDLTGNFPEDLADIPNLTMVLIQNNTITGTAEKVCALEETPQVFVVDYKDIMCDCCTDCFSDDGLDCDELMLGSYDPTWESGYTRDEFRFADDVIFTKVKNSATSGRE